MEHDDLERLLVEHTDAWNAHDLDRLMRLFAPDCVFHASAGPDAEGATYVGHDRVRSAFAAVLASMPDAQWREGRHHVLGDRDGVSRWRLTATTVDGARLDVLGCDFLTVDDAGRLVRKNSFRKQRVSPASGPR